MDARRLALMGAAVMAAVCLAALVFAFTFDGTPSFTAPNEGAEASGEGQDEPTADEIPLEQDGAASSEGSAGANVAQVPAMRVVVHVSGAVASPGVYEVNEGARVQDAVDAAGGFSADAAIDAVNLARILSDGEQVLIPTEDQVADGMVSRPTDAGSPGDSSASEPVNINTAGADELDSLPGVGPATAQAIIDEREANGPFESVEDIQRVSGIGEKKFEKLKDSIRV